MYQTPNADHQALSTYETNFNPFDAGTNYEPFGADTNACFRPSVNEDEDLDNATSNQHEEQHDPNDSISLVLEEIGAALNDKDFIDLGKQKQANTNSCNKLAQEYQQQPRYLAPNNNIINNRKYTPPVGQSAARTPTQPTNNLEHRFDSFYENQPAVNGAPVDQKGLSGIVQKYNHNNNNLNLKDQEHMMNMMDEHRAPYVEIVEQPAKCALRFRYKCEGRSAGSLPGVNSTAENKTYPSIRINNYVGRAVVVISCVTKDLPYKSHPHNIVGKEGCKKGICTIVINNEENMVRTFSSLGIQCVKRKDIEESLSLRESIKVDPFRNGFAHKLCASNIDLNVVRLCFQVFITGSTPNKCDVPLTPVVSEPIHDKKAMSDLVITKLSHCSAPATGGREVILLCDRISKDDIQIRFYEERDGKLLWETFTELSPNDVHKQVAICFKTPKYHNENITQPVMARIQLRRVSDNQVSEPRLFQFLPCESDEDIISRKRQKIELFNMNHYALDNILQPNHQQQHPMMNRSPPANHHHHQHHHQQQARLQDTDHQQQQQHRLQVHPMHQQQQPVNAQLCMLASPHQQQGNAREDSPASHLQPRRPSPVAQQRHEFQPGTSRPPTRSPQQTPSPTQQMQQQQLPNQYHQQQQNSFMIDSQNLVVRREIIDNEGRVMRLVDRPSAGDPQAANAANRPLDSSLDRIHISELMPDMTFNQNIDLNLGLGLSMHLNGANGNDS